MSGFKELAEKQSEFCTGLKVIKTDIAWLKKLLFLILGIVLANLGAFILRTAP
jgi:hypothetical protein